MERENSVLSQGHERNFEKIYDVPYFHLMVHGSFKKSAFLTFTPFRPLLLTYIINSFISLPCNPLKFYYFFLLAL